MIRFRPYRSLSTSRSTSFSARQYSSECCSFSNTIFVSPSSKSWIRARNCWSILRCLIGHPETGRGGLIPSPCHQTHLESNRRDSDYHLRLVAHPYRLRMGFGTAVRGRHHLLAVSL